VEKFLREEGWPDCQYIKDWNQTLADRREARYQSAIEETRTSLKSARREVIVSKAQIGALGLIGVGGAAVFAYEVAGDSYYPGDYKSATLGSLFILATISLISWNPIKKNLLPAFKARNESQDRYNYLEAGVDGDEQIYGYKV
jgi:hypothetical protein